MYLPRRRRGSAVVPALLGGAVSKGRQELVARGFAPPTRLGTDFAMFVHLGVLFALVGAGLASDQAGLKKRLGDTGIVAGVAGQDVASCYADIGAVQVGADALDQVGDLVFGQAS